MAEIANFTPEQLAQYEESLKVYRDLKGVVDTSYEEGKNEGKIEIALKMKKMGEPVEKISEYVPLRFTVTSWLKSGFCRGVSRCVRLPGSPPGHLQ